MDVDAIILSLALEPHPEGGYYRQTWADDASTAIYFLLREGEFSSWHRLLGRTEVWHFYAGDPLELSVDTGAPGSAATRTITTSRPNMREPSRTGANEPAARATGLQQAVAGARSEHRRVR